MIKLRLKRFCRSNSKLGIVGDGRSTEGCGGRDIEWEQRPGGMLVQKREGGKNVGLIKVRVSMGTHWHDVSIGATSTFGELKVVLSFVTGLEPREQRILFRGKEREDGDHLHMVGVQDSDKVLLLEDPATKELKLSRMASSCRTIMV